MAKTQNPLIGSSEGPLGEIYMYRKDGANIIKTRTSSNYGDPTPAQTLRRDEMRILGQAWRSLAIATTFPPIVVVDLARTGYQPAYPGAPELFARYTKVWRNQLFKLGSWWMLEPPADIAGPNGPQAPEYLLPEVGIEEPISVEIEDFDTENAITCQVNMRPTRPNGDPGDADVGVVAIWNYLEAQWKLPYFIEETRAEGSSSSEYTTWRAVAQILAYPIIIGEDGYLAQGRKIVLDIF